MTEGFSAEPALDGGGGSALAADPWQALAAAVDRLQRADTAEPHADADAEAEYASDLVALAARDLVRHVERSPDRRPAGWDDRAGSGLTETERQRGVIRTMATVVKALSRSLKAAWIELEQGHPEAAREWIANSLPGEAWDGDEWDGTETAQEWSGRTEARRG